LGEVGLRQGLQHLGVGALAVIISETVHRDLLLSAYFVICPL
jgi:hypothetical protein